MSTEYYRGWRIEGSVNWWFAYDGQPPGSGRDFETVKRGKNRADLCAKIDQLGWLGQYGGEAKPATLFDLMEEG